MNILLLLWKVLSIIIGAVVKHLLPLWKNIQSIREGLPHSRKVRPKFPKMNLKETAKVKAENKKAQEFIEVLHVAAEQGFSKWAVFTQAWHETGAFKYVIGSHNYWGIKVPRNWTGKIEMVETHEYIRGKNTPVVATFIDFDTALEAISWYCNFIRRLYPNAYRNRKEPAKYFEGLINGSLKYATDPNYLQRLTALLKVLKSDINISYLIDNV